jgi:hypothetical protein
MRPLIEILDDEGDRERAYIIATSNGNHTAKSFERAAWETWVMREMAGSVIASRLESGEIGAKQAYRVGKIAGGDSTIQLCTDPELANALVEMRESGSKLWHEIKATLCVPTIEGQIPLPDATLSNLQAYLVLDSAERRAQHVENNRAYYDRLRQLDGEIISRAERVGGLIMNDDEATKPEAWELLQLIEERKRLKENNEKDNRGPGQ